MDYLYKMRRLLGWGVLFLLFIVPVQAFGLYRSESQRSSMEIFQEEMVKNAPDSIWCWADSAATSEELILKSDLIGIGKVVDSYTELHHTLVFTKNIVEISSVVMLSENLMEEAFYMLPDSPWPNNRENEYAVNEDTLLIEVGQDGGFYDYSYTKPPREASLLEIGKTYAFFLEYTEEGYYLPVGAYQGVAEVSWGRIRFPEETSFRYPKLHNIKSRALAAQISGLFDGDENALANEVT